MEKSDQKQNLATQATAHLSISEHREALRAALIGPLSAMSNFASMPEQDRKEAGRFWIEVLQPYSVAEVKAAFLKHAKTGGYPNPQAIAKLIEAERARKAKFAALDRRLQQPEKDENRTTGNTPDPRVANIIAEMTRKKNIVGNAPPQQWDKLLDEHEQYHKIKTDDEIRADLAKKTEGPKPETLASIGKANGG